MTKLSVNINKIALIRNSRGANYPDLVAFAKDCERFGAQGITVHPRPDGRHVRYQDCQDLREVVTTELNIEGYPSDDFIEMVNAVKPEQVTLVPDAPDALTSDQGWNTVEQESLLMRVIEQLRVSGARISLFVDPIEQLIEGALKVGADRVELYTGPYAKIYKGSPEHAIENYEQAARYADEIGLGINAGHDLNLDNLQYFKQHIPHLQEVSIGHAIVCDALYYGMENTIRMYRRCLE